MGDKKAEKEFIAEFIEVYRGLPALWDVKCKDYTNRAKKGEQYDVLIEKYREKYPDAEKQEYVRKIKCFGNKLPERMIKDSPYREKWCRCNYHATQFRVR